MEVFDQQEFAKIKARAETFYKSVVKVRCPALGTDVHFSSDGFHHLQYDGTRTPRTKLARRSKLLCIQEAVDIIKKTTTMQEYRSAIQPVGKADSSGFRQTKHVAYWAFHAITDLTKPRRVNVVVRRIGDGNYHFWSVAPSWKEVKINGSQTVRKIGGGWMMDA